ncbi:MAG TPA: hypothetical protein VD962_03925 [Rubricoccaceae bacterium]|nr:hypothetical protein [Rubricoccaceae bacterium]
MRRLADVLSYVLNPLAWPPIGFALVQAHFGASGAEVAFSLIVVFVFFAAVPLGYLVWLWRRGEVASLEVRERRRRLRPLAVGIASYVAGLVALAVVGRTAEPLVLALALQYPVNTLVVLLITLRWKISIHCVGVAGFAVALLVVASLPWPWPSLPVLTPANTWPVLLLIPPVMWARVASGAHTRAQAVGGALFGLLVPAAELGLFRLAAL